jgi:putative ABC transport system ATP-binding protein
MATNPLAARGLVRRFDHGSITPLAGVDFTVRPGEMVAVTGASGSGKTTLLNVLGLLDRPDGGELRVDGIDVATVGERQLRRIRANRLGFVFQDALLDMRRSALENVMLGLRFAAVGRRSRRDLAREALAVTGTEERADARGATLSGGERQRVAIARAIAHGPAALLCDEPTGALDDGNTTRSGSSRCCAGSRSSRRRSSSSPTTRRSPASAIAGPCCAPVASGGRDDARARPRRRCGGRHRPLARAVAAARARRRGRVPRPALRPHGSRSICRSRAGRTAGSAPSTCAPSLASPGWSGSRGCSNGTSG